LEQVFRFHPIAVEDARRPHQRPKVDEYDGYFFMTADEILLNPRGTGAEADEETSSDVTRRQVAMFVGRNYLVTVHTVPAEAVRELRGRCTHSARLLARDPDYVLYALLDALVDRYFSILDQIEDRMDEIEDSIVATADPNILQTIFRYKRDLAILRRFFGPLREAIQTLTTREFPNIHTTMLPYFRDVADHLFRVYEILDGYRDLTSNMLDAYLSQVSNQMNRVMQRLAVVGTVFLPITFLTGVFGMNFVDQPWLKTNPWFWLAVMVVTAGATLVWFHRRKLV
jgi:magnesium transporter